MTLANDRGYALTIAQRFFYERNVTLDVVLETFGDTEDVLIIRLVDLMVHEPARTGLITVSRRDYEKNYWPHVAAVLTELEKGDAGILPPEPRVTAKRLIWSAVFVLFLGAVSAENLRDFFWHVSGRQQLHIIFAALKLGFGVLLGIMTTVGVLGIIRGVRIAISQRRDERRRAGGV